MGIFNKKTTEHYFNKPSNATVGQCFTMGNAITKASFFVFGLGNILNKQIGRGLIFLAIEIAYLIYMITFGIGALGDMVTLGTATQEEVFNEALGIYEYTKGDNSMLCLLFGVATIMLTIAIVFFGCMSGKSAFATQFRKEKGMHVPTFMDDLRSIKEENLHVAMMAFPIVGVLVFTITPLIYTILVAFTNYDREHQPPGNLFDWVGMENFANLFASGGKLANTFWPVLGWTLIWAVLATITCYVGGLILALLINRKGTRIKGFWRFMFVISIAVPQFVTLLSMRTIFAENGPVNVILQDLGLVDGPVYWFIDPTLARILIICINFWIGVPFTMLSTTGILQNIPAELYEAAKIDGANAITIFFKITLPYMVFVMTPSLITSFTGNINNFNVIFLLSGGGPNNLNYYFAGDTDLLVTWLYNLTITQKDYNLGAVIGILTFIVLATVSLLTYRNTASYKDEGAFQ
ncbi:MAG: sugar ABC transporter permease [Agathobacter sp.]|nr:sugar ABC transporter permease [Agathobacter sp.]